MQMPKALIDRNGFASQVRKAEQKLKRLGHVVSVRHTLDYDMDGTPVVWFLVVLPDASVAADRLLWTTDLISVALRNELQPEFKWGVYPHFRFRSKTEQETIQEPAWA